MSLTRRPFSFFRRPCKSQYTVHFQLQTVHFSRDPGFWSEIHPGIIFCLFSQSHFLRLVNAKFDFSDFIYSEDACVSDRIEEWQNKRGESHNMNKNNLYDHNVYQKQEYKVRISYKLFYPKIIYPSRAVGTILGVESYTVDGSKDGWKWTVMDRSK